MSEKISQLPPYSGPDSPAGYIPISVMGTTYRIDPSKLSGRYKAKRENEDANFSLGSFEYIEVGEASFCKIITQTTGRLKAIQVSDGNPAVYPGKEYTIKNETGAALVFKSNDPTFAGSTYKKFNLPNGADFILNSGESTVFHYTGDRFEVVGKTTVSHADVSGLSDNYVNLTGAQTVVGAKTFSNLALQLRNSANTFTSKFQSLVTAARTWTMPDRDGTVALIEDIPQTNVPQIIYIDGTNGSDTTGTISNKAKPFKTLDAAIAAVNSNTYWRFEILTPGTYLIAGNYYGHAYGYGASGQLWEFYSLQNVKISFEGNATGTIFGIGSNYTHLFFNIPNGTFFGSNANAVTISSRGDIKIICKNFDTGSFSASTPLFSQANNFHLEADKITTNRQYLVSHFTYYVRDFYVRVFNVVANYAGCSLVSSGNGAHVEILNAVSGSGWYIVSMSKGYHSIKDYSATGGNLVITSGTSECTVEFLDSKISGSNIDLSGWSFGDVTLTGRISESSTATLKGTSVSQGTLRLTNFHHDLKTSTLYLYKLAKVVLSDTCLKVTNVPFSRYNTQATTIELRGTNTFYSTNPTVVFNTSNTAPVTIENYGVLKTNIPSWGVLVTVNDMAAAIVHGTGDVTKAGIETISGLKTFLNGKIGLRNSYDTFTSYFNNFSTLSRSWIMPDKSGTVALLSDLPKKTAVFTFSAVWDTINVGSVHVIGYYNNQIIETSSPSTYTFSEALKGENVGMFVAPYNCIITKVLLIDISDDGHDSEFTIGSGAPDYWNAWTNDFLSKELHVQELISKTGSESVYNEFVSTGQTIPTGFRVCPMFRVNNQNNTKKNFTIQIEILEV